LREASKSAAVLVEGKRDAAALRRFGIKNVFEISGRRYADLTEELESFNRIILLLDCDRQGEKAFAKLKALLEAQNFEVDASFREFLKKEGVEEVEHLPGFIFRG